MHTTSMLEMVGRQLTSQESREIASGINAGRVFDVGFFDAVSAKTLLAELLSLEAAHIDIHRPYYCQILASQTTAVIAWGTTDRQDARLLNLGPYPLLSHLLSNLKSISDALRREHEELLLSVLPALRRTRSSARFYHRESHTCLQQLEREGASPTLYRMCCDLGLENSSEVINVDIVRRDVMLESDGALSPQWRPLFQQQYIDYGSSGGVDRVAQKQLTEEMLPFPDRQRELRPGRGFLWNDDLFFHAPYLRRGRHLNELSKKPRSIVVINEFRDNRFREIEWSPQVRKLLKELH